MRDAHLPRFVIKLHHKAGTASAKRKPVPVIEKRWGFADAGDAHKFMGHDERARPQIKIARNVQPPQRPLGKRWHYRDDGECVPEFGERCIVFSLAGYQTAIVPKEHPCERIAMHPFDNSATRIHEYFDVLC